MYKPIAHFTFAFVALFTAVTQAQTIKIKDSDIKNDKYSFNVGFTELADQEATQKLLSESTAVSFRHEDAGPVYITPAPSATHAEIRLTFDFSDCSYVVESIFIRDVFNFFARPDEPVDAMVKATISEDAGEPHDLWSIVCGTQSRHEDPFESSVKLENAKKVTYSVSMDIQGNDAIGSFGDAAFQWNRLNSPEDDSTRAFKIVFQLKKVR